MPVLTKINTNALSDSAVTSAKVRGDVIAAGDLAPNSVDSSELVNGAVDLSHMSVNSVDSDQYVDGSIDLVHMSANSIDSDQYVDGSIDLAHMSVNSIDSDQYVDASIDTAHLASNIAISTSGAITTTGAFTSIGIDDNADATAITIDSGEKVCIGTGTANRKLTVIGDNDEPDISLVQLHNANDNYNEIRFMSVGTDDSTYRVGGSIKAIYTGRSGTNPETDLTFWTRTTAGSLTKRFSVAADGNLVHGAITTQRMGYWYEGHSSTGNTTGSYTFGLSSHRIWATFKSGGNKRADVVFFNGRLNPGQWTATGIKYSHGTPALFSGGGTVSDANNTYNFAVSGGNNQLIFSRSSGSTDWDLHVKYMTNSS